VINVIRYRSERAHFFRADVSNYKQVEDVCQEIRRLGDVNILINNAGILNCLPLTELHSAAIKKTIKVNLMAHFWTIKCVLPRMMQLKQGHIVSIASNFGLLGRGCFTDYTYVSTLSRGVSFFCH
jgi:all-trans-retinol dehydrogenase (NAD+)